MADRTPDNSNAIATADALMSIFGMTRVTYAKEEDVFRSMISARHEIAKSAQSRAKDLEQEKACATNEYEQGYYAGAIESLTAFADGLIELNEKAVARKERLKSKKA